MVEPLLIGQIGVGAVVRGLEHHHPKRHMDLGGGQSGAVRIYHGFHHVIDQAADFRRFGVGNGPGGKGQDGMAHAGDFQNCHGPKYDPVSGPGQGWGTVNFRG